MKKLSLAAILILAVTNLHADEWNQWRGPQRDGVWRETGIIEKFASDTIPHKWSVPIGAGYSGPTVADGRVYVTDRVTEPDEVERVHCFDWKTGDSLWSYSYPCKYNVGYPLGPRASVAVDDGLAYALGTMGNFHCFDAATGEVKWEKDLMTEYKIDLPTWGISASPLVDGDLVILHIGGADGACIVAFDKKTGEEKWRALNDPVSYSPPYIIEQADKRVMVCWTGGSISGLDPQTGELYWQHPFKPKKGIINISTPILENNRLFFTSFYDGSIMLEINPDKLEVKELWSKVGRNEQNTEALHSIISTPVMVGDYVYGVDSYGEMRCLDARTGERVWEDLSVIPKSRWATVHFVRHGDVFWMPNEFGELVIGKLSPQGVEVISRAQLIEPTTELVQRDRPICWSHPAFAYKHVFARSDKELICASLEE